jgi:Rrf2 family protein
MQHPLAVEYALHSLLHLGDLPPNASVSVGRLADFQGIPSAYAAKILQDLKRARLVKGAPGPHGGFRLDRPLDSISFLEVVEAIEGTGPWFQCQDVRFRCVLFRDHPSKKPRGLCQIHGVMLEAERRHRQFLGSQFLARVRDEVHSKLGPGQVAEIRRFLSPRLEPDTA